MERSSATPEDFARVVVKAHHNASYNERAQYRNRVTVDDVLSSRVIRWPLTLLMCSPIGDGAAAAVIASHDGLVRLASHELGRPKVKVLASVVRSGTRPGGATAATAAARAAYDVAGVGPEDLSLAEIHDASASAELMIYEELGLAKPGDAPRLVREEITALGGRIPVNPSGGLLCRGHPIGATGVAQIAEATWQLRGEAGPRQVQNPRIALTENGGGWLENDAAAMAVHIFQRIPAGRSTAGS
jgi:acetyl-CoA acetyltransferase